MKKSLFHTIPVTRNAVLTPESGIKEKPFVQNRSFIAWEKADVQHTSEAVIAAFAYGDGTSSAISRADTLYVDAVAVLEAAFLTTPPMLLSTYPLPGTCPC